MEQRSWSLSQTSCSNTAKPKKCRTSSGVEVVGQVRMVSAVAGSCSIPFFETV